jgi:hypothetical protein
MMTDLSSLKSYAETVYRKDIASIGREMGAMVVYRVLVSNV